MANAPHMQTGEPLVQQTVHVVEDDEQFRISLIDQLESLGIHAFGFDAALDFFSHASQDAGGCILLDVRLPDLNGIEFQKELKTRGYDLPVVFMTAHGDVTTSVSAMKAGAVDFLPKPLQRHEVVEAITTAFTIDRERQTQRAYRKEILERAATLTPREVQIIGLVVGGSMNKQIAFELGISEIMVKLHRGRAMKKMRAASLAELVRQFEYLSH